MKCRTFAAAYDDSLERLRQEQQLRNIRPGQLEDGTQTEVKQIRCAHLFHPAVADLVRDARILDRIETLSAPTFV
jgi:hypothetical protein